MDNLFDSHLQKQAERLGELKLEERQREREREARMYVDSTSTTSQKKRLSRSAYVLIQFATVLFLILALIVIYHLIH